MAYTTINKHTAHFDTNLYQANGTGKTISGMDFQSDLIWTKNRDNASYIHAIVDAVRGGTKKLFTNNTNAESTDANAITAFNSDGYTFGSSGSFNNGTDDYVNWCWKANGAGSSNTDGSITSTVSANTTAGFSIVKYTGTGSNATVGHGLGVAPKMIIVKCLDTAKAWTVYHSALGSSAAIFLEQTSAATTSNTTYFGGTDPTTSVFSIGSSTNVTNSGDEFIAYCFAEKTGYSKFGSYTGNGSTDGTFVYTGFKPAFVMIKKSSANDGWWQMQDNKRDVDNPAEKAIFANVTDAEYSGSNYYVDYLSSGFKCRSTNAGTNTSGGTYIYMAFGQTMVGTNNIPATAR